MDLPVHDRLSKAPARRGVAALLAAAMALLLAAPAAAESLEEPGRLAAVQQRKFRMDHELFAAAAFLPWDAFYKGLGPSAGYTLHFTDSMAWEVVRGTYSFSLPTSLREQLEQDYAVAPTRFEEVQILAGSAFMFTPLYGKFSLFNRSVLHGEAYGLAGGSVAKMTETFKVGPQVGLGVRLFLTESVSLRAETRYHALFSNGLTHVIDVSSGVAIDFGSAD